MSLIIKSELNLRARDNTAQMVDRVCYVDQNLGGDAMYQALDGNDGQV